jgi:hypothetical protein
MSDIEWRIGERGPEPWHNGHPLLWAPLEGSQRAFLACDDLICLYESGRGVGKTLCALMDFCGQVGQGFGREHRGLFVRQTYKQLSEAINLAQTWLPRIFPGATWNKMGGTYEFVSGEKLWFSYIENANDTDRFLGHSFSWICADELASWPDLATFKFLLSCLRSANPKIKLHARALTNPFGVGRAAIMRAFRLPLQPGTIVGPLIVDDDPEAEDYLPPRRVIHGFLGENIFLANTDYARNIAGSTDDPARKAAWLLGSWAEPTESMFGDLFQTHRQYIEVPNFQVPSPDRIRVSLDHGTAAPAAAVFTWENTYAEDIRLPDGTTITRGVRGDTYIVGIAYFATKRDKGLNLPIAEIAARLRAYCVQRGWPVDILRRDGNILDSACFANDGRPSIADNYRAAGCSFEPCSKGPNSRAMGATLLREMLAATAPTPDGERLKPGLFVCAHGCDAFWSTIPFVQRDGKDAAVWAEGQSDHCLDAVLYKIALSERPQPSVSGRIDAAGFHPMVMR